MKKVFRPFYLLLLLLPLAMVMPASAQSDIQVTASITPPEIRPGGIATLTITVAGGDAADLQMPILPSGIALAAATRNTSSEMSSINGVLTRSYSQSWQITSKIPGEFTIPEQTILVNGSPYQTNNVQLKVDPKIREQESPYTPMIGLEIEKRKFYVGEQIPITVNVYVSSRALLRRVGLIELPKDNFAIQRFPIQGNDQTVEMSGQIFRTILYKSTLTALKPGKFTLGPATSEIILEVPTAEGGFFFQQEQRRFNPQSNEIELEVLPLPAEGRPKDFTGVVGDFEIDLSADPTSLSVGDPIAVEISITGSGNFDAITSPPLTKSEGWKLYPPRRYDMGNSDTETGEPHHQVGFSQVLIPQEPVSEIPSYEFNYFSPTKKQYVTLRTKPVALKVTGSALPKPSSSSQVPGSVQNNAAPDSGKVPQAVAQTTDILAFVPDSAAWLTVRPPPWTTRTFIIVNAVIAGCITLLLLGKLVSYLNQRSASRPDHDTKLIWKKLNTFPINAGAFYTLAAEYISASKLHGAEVNDVLRKHDAILYSRDSATTEQPLSREERAEVLAQLRPGKRTTTQSPHPPAAPPPLPPEPPAPPSSTASS